MIATRSGAFSVAKTSADCRLKHVRRARSSRTAAAALRSLETKFAATVSAARAAQDEAQIRMERMHGEHLERVAFYEDRITRLEQERHAEKENGLLADEVFKTEQHAFVFGFGYRF